MENFQGAILKLHCNDNLPGVAEKIVLEKSVAMTDKGLLVGRKQVGVAIPQISKVHAAFLFSKDDDDDDDAGWYICHESLNGLKLNGITLEKEISGNKEFSALKSGDIITFLDSGDGKLEYKFLLPGAPELIQESASSECASSSVVEGYNEDEENPRITHDYQNMLADFFGQLRERNEIKAKLEIQNEHLKLENEQLKLELSRERKGRKSLQRQNDDLRQQLELEMKKLALSHKEQKIPLADNPKINCNPQPIRRSKEE